jgi:flagellar biosynthesis protein FlhF
MRIKVYTATGMPQAMALIRSELGSDAVILNSRRIAGGVEVTAARDEPDLPPPLPQCAPPSCPLLAHGVPERLAAKLRAGPLPFALSIAFRFQPIDAVTIRRPLLFIGPPGAGKTLTVARLATRLVLAKTPPDVITADTRRTGAYEQLAAYTDLLGIPLRNLDELRARTPTLIDAPGLDPFDSADRAELATLIRQTSALPILVLPAGLDPNESLELAEAFATLGAARLIATRLDIARRLGGILAAATRLPLTEAGISPAAPAGLVPMTPDLLARRLARPPHRSNS